MTSALWTPSPERVGSSHMARFMRAQADADGPVLEDWPTLYRWSVERPADFWAAVWRYCELRHSRPWTSVLEHGERMPGARWFAGARLNFAENLLRRRDQAPALIFVGEDGARRSVSHAELARQVAALGETLRGAGLRAGDRVAGYLPNIPETVVAMLATAGIGAVWSSASPDFGEQAVLDRFGQIGPRVLIAADGYRYKGRAIDRRGQVATLRRALVSVQQVIVVPHLQADPDLGPIPDAVSWRSALAGDATEPRFEALPFEHPLYILFSSGTTGRPKCIVHGAGGTLLQHLKELVLHTDLGPGDRLLYFTTCGWMMWNWMASALATGATLVLYDGAPFHPGPGALIDVVEREAVTVFGTSARYVAELEKAGVTPVDSHDLAALRSLLSTGSPLAPESFDYVYRAVKPDLQLASISGGTDIVSCFALGNPLLPVHRGELQSPGLGMRVAVYSPDGRELQGEKGELVCTAPFPSMPLGFWGDEDGSRYRAAYFERFPGVWAHGDYAEMTPSGGLVIHGRSDAVLNPGGVRIGTAEIYRQIERLAEVDDCLAVGQQWQGDERVVLFVALREGLALDAPLIERIRRVIREHASPRHVPAVVLQVSAIPRTRTGKLVELAVREVIHGREVTNRAAIANPEVLAEFADRLELGPSKRRER